MTVLIGGSSCLLCAALFARKLPALGKTVHTIYMSGGYYGIPLEVVSEEQKEFYSLEAEFSA